MSCVYTESGGRTGLTEGRSTDSQDLPEPLSAAIAMPGYMRDSMQHCREAAHLVMLGMYEVPLLHPKTRPVFGNELRVHEERRPHWQT